MKTRETEQSTTDINGKDKVVTMKKNNLKKIIKGAVCVAMALAVSIAGVPIAGESNGIISTIKTAKAATVTNRLPIVTYTRNTSGNIATYSDISLTKSTGYICYYDRCTILNIYNNGVVKVRYPVRRGTRTAYASMTDFFGSNDFDTRTAGAGARRIVYRKSRGNSTIGTVFSTDNVTIVALDVSACRTQIIYPTSSGYKLGWINGLYKLPDGNSNNNNNNQNGDSFASIRAKYPNNSLWNGSYRGKAWQCHGFALTLGYERTGTDPYGWSKTYNLNSLKPGDIIVCKRPHTIMVTGVSGNTITYVDCNWVGKNKVRWNQKIGRWQITSKFGRLKYVMVSPR